MWQLYWLNLNMLTLNTSVSLKNHWERKAVFFGLLYSNIEDSCSHGVSSTLHNSSWCWQSSLRVCLKFSVGGLSSNKPGAKKKHVIQCHWNTAKSFVRTQVTPWLQLLRPIHSFIHSNSFWSTTWVANSTLLKIYIFDMKKDLCSLLASLDMEAERANSHQFRIWNDKFLLSVSLKLSHSQLKLVSQLYPKTQSKDLRG